MYLPNPIIDRVNRETWAKEGGKSLQQRAHDEVERRLAAYTPVETDPRADAELRRILQSAMTTDALLPAVPPPPTSPVVEGRGRRERRRAREQR